MMTQGLANDDVLEILEKVFFDRKGTILCQFLDASGSRVVLRMDPEIALKFGEKLAQLKNDI